jgi:uncharacterized membrane protein
MNVGASGPPSQSAPEGPSQSFEELETDRIIGLSDGIFAFAMTLMVLTVDVPKPEAVPPAELPGAVVDQWPQFIGYVISFLVVGIFWMEHHRLFRCIRKQDTGLMWLNTCFLLCIAALPFVTDLVGEYDDHPFAVVLYAGSMVVTSLMLHVVWRYASHRHRLLHPSVHPQHVSYLSARSLVVPLVFLASIALSSVSLQAAKLSWALTVPILYLVARRYARS